MHTQPLLCYANNIMLLTNHKMYLPATENLKILIIAVTVIAHQIKKVKYLWQDIGLCLHITW